MTRRSHRRRIASQWCATVLLVAAMVLGACSDDDEYARSPASVGTGGDPQTIDVRLIDASERGDLSEVQKLLAVGSSVRYTDDRGRTALIAAAYANQVNVAKVLIATGADVNVQDASQQSAYLISTSEGFVELLTLTLANGADVKSLDSFNGTGLIRAAHRGHGDIVRLLLRTNIDVNHVNRLGWTALLESILLGDGGAKYIDVVTQLVAAKADVNLAGRRGRDAVATRPPVEPDRDRHHPRTIERASRPAISLRSPSTTRCARRS